MKQLLNIREANAADVEDIFRLLEMYVNAGTVLKRSREDILFYIGNFVAAEFDGRMCGCCAVRDFGNNLLEVRSLVVDPQYHGKGIGRAMLEAIISGLKLHRETWRLFTLTKEPGFFRKLGFQDVEKEVFPEKIWSDCSQCPKFNCCDEVALLLTSESKLQKNCSTDIDKCVQ